MTCCCSLAGTVACINCPNRTSSIYTDWTTTPTWYQPPQPQKTRTIEKFDTDGNLIERIIEWVQP